MQSIKINSGEIRLCVNDDQNRLICFNPDDLDFVDSLFLLINEFEEKQKEFEQRVIALDSNKEVDALGIPKNIRERIKLTRDTCEYMKTSIDNVFGEGTSKAAFGSANTLDMFPQFFDGITPFVKKHREAKQQKYKNRSKNKGVMR